MSEQENVIASRELLFDLYAHMIEARRHLVFADDQSSEASIEAALVSFDHVGRTLAGLIGASPLHFESPPPIQPVRRGLQPSARVIRLPSGGPVEAIASMVIQLVPRSSSPDVQDTGPAADDHADEVTKPLRPSGGVYGFRPMPVVHDVMPAATRKPDADPSAFDDYDEDEVITSAPKV